MLHAFALVAGMAVGLALADLHARWKWRSIPSLRALLFYMAAAVVAGAFYGTCYFLKIWPWG